MLRRLAFLWLMAAGSGLLPGLGTARGQSEGPLRSGEQFDQQSLALRTALFHDPSLDQPLQRLVELYQKAGREEELLGLYRSHLVQYPEDAGSNAVLVRLLLALKRPEASTAAAGAMEAHPDDPLTIYLRHTDLQLQRDPRALEVLSRAVEKETDPLRKSAWTDQLVAAALAEDRRDLAEKHLRALAARTDQTAAQQIALGQRLNRDGFSALALEVLAAAARNSPAPESTVELDLQAAAAESALGQTAEAARRLEALLGRVAPDYNRRAEIVARRVALLTTDAERASHLQRARDAWASAPSSEAAALDLAELLAACELRQEALRVLRTATTRLPLSEPLEKATLALLDRLGDERGTRDFIRERLATQPDRADLAARLVTALHALGAHAEAAAEFEKILATLPEADRPTRRLDLARALRRMTLPAEAAAQLEKVLAADPKRLDVRRELAEARLAANDPAGARQLMREAVAPDAAIENFLDVVSFMMAPASSATWPEARDALRDRLVREPRNFEVAMLLVDVLGRLGELPDGEAVLAQARALADTDARYRRWLETGLAFSEAAGTAESFFDAEQARLVSEADDASGGWTTERATRYLLLCETANQGDVEPRLIAALKARLDDAATPADLRIPLRRLLVEALRRDPTQAVEVQNQLQQLADEDTEHADEHRLRLARSGHEAAPRDGGRPDQVRALLRTVDVEKIADPTLLRGTHKLFLEYGYPGPALAVLERLTLLEPGDPGHWERWISALAIQGEEERLREALRRVLSGVTTDPLDVDTLNLLRAHLVDSCWRSVARLFAQADPAGLAGVLPLLEVIERTREPGPEMMWVTWARGQALRLAGRADAAAEAATRLEALAERWFAASPTPVRLQFPDGLAMSLEQALASLREAPERPAGPAAAPAGPDRAPSMRWGFVTEAGAVITQVAALGDGTNASVVVLDQAGTLSHLDAATGKLRWQRRGLWTGGSSAPTPTARGRRARTASGFFGNDGNIPVTVTPRLAVDEVGGRLLVSRDGVVTAFAADDARVLWQASVTGPARRVPTQPGVTPLPPLADELFIDADGRVVLWRAETATAAGIHAQTGKLLWSHEVATEVAPPLLGPLNSGASCEGTRLLVYGHRPAVLDTATGAELWSFAGEKVREFPVSLKSTASATASPSAATVAAPAPALAPAPRGGFLPGGLNAPRRLAVNYLRPLTDRASVLGQWMEGKGALVAPAVAWAEQAWQPISGELARGRLVLTMPGLILAPSLALPLGGPRLETQAGTSLGTTGTRAVFLDEQALTVFDLARGGSVTVPLGSVTATGEPAGSADTPPTPPLLTVDGTVAGPRVFVTGPGGLLAVNPLSGRVLFSEPWAEPVRRFLGLDPPAAASAPGNPGAPAMAPMPPSPARSTQFTPRYVLHSSATSNLALRPRHAARGRWLFAVLGADRLAAFAAE
jgi:thioredoxin-like negative regulator of GroEL